MLHMPSTLRTLLLLLPLLLLPLSLQAQKRNSAYEAYIEQYKSLAIEQMNKYHIPASITLAQGLLESAAGQSTLARRSNNHFGIKCHNDWKGKRTYHDDDARGECFRVYSSVRDSYEDHSLFLQRARYSSLFRVPIPCSRAGRGGRDCCSATTRDGHADSRPADMPP